MNEHTEGHSIPSPIAETGSLTQWLYQLIRPALKGKVLEIGSGRGTLSSLFVQDGFALRISDPDKFNCELLKNRFSGEPLIKGVHQLDLTTSTFDIVYKNYIEKFDTVVSILGADEILDHPLRVGNAKRLLKDRGRLIILLPGHIALYGNSDIGFGQWRRSNRRDLSHRLGKDCEIVKIQFLSILETASSAETDPENLYIQQVPSFNPIDDAPFNEAGLYAIAIARKVLT